MTIKAKGSRVLSFVNVKEKHRHKYVSQLKKVTRVDLLILGKIFYLLLPLFIDLHIIRLFLLSLFRFLQVII